MPRVFRAFALILLWTSGTVAAQTRKPAAPAKPPDAPVNAPVPASPGKPVTILDNKMALKGRTIFIVSVDDMPGMDGVLSAQTLKTDTESRLRQKGITVKQLTDDNGAAAFAPSLEIHPGILKLENGEYVYSITANVIELVEVFGVDPERVTLANATVWDDGKYGIASQSNVAATVKHVVDDLVSGFLNDYLVNNPNK